MERLLSVLKGKKDRGLLRKLRAVDHRGPGVVVRGGERLLDFSSNDYLGISSHPYIKKASSEALNRWGTASSASRLLSGSLSLHHELEEMTAAFKGKEAALVFNSGYQANVGIISSLYGRRDLIFSDRLSHASILDGIRLSGARHIRYRHNDMEHLEYLLKKNTPGKDSGRVVITESVFSMDGDMADLQGIVDLKDQYGFRIMADEAHATGIFGRSGSGMAEQSGLTDRIDFIMGTFSKAMGSFGAYLAASGPVRDYLVNTCRSFIYSTALPPSVIAASKASLELVEQEPFRREVLMKKTCRFRSSLEKAGLETRGSSQIIPVIIPDPACLERVSEFLRSRGFYVLPVRPPTVPEGEARLRFSLCVDHGDSDLDMLAGLVREVL